VRGDWKKLLANGIFAPTYDLGAVTVKHDALRQMAFMMKADYH
jgi:hypothetical protein